MKQNEQLQALMTMMNPFAAMVRTTEVAGAYRDFLQAQSEMMRASVDATQQIMRAQTDVLRAMTDYSRSGYRLHRLLTSAKKAA